MVRMWFLSLSSFRPEIRGFAGFQGGWICFLLVTLFLLVAQILSSTRSSSRLYFLRAKSLFPDVFLSTSCGRPGGDLKFAAFLDIFQAKSRLLIPISLHCPLVPSGPFSSVRSQMRPPLFILPSKRSLSKLAMVCLFFFVNLSVKRN